MEPPEGPASPQRSEPEAADGRHAGPGGRLIVFLVQKDLERHRITGLMRLGPMVDAVMQPLTAEDRVAVLSFDSRLRYWTDFTNDLPRVRQLLARDVTAGRPGAVGPSGDVTLLSRLTPESASRTYRIEHALRHIAGALEPLPGAKSVILLGYGLGRFDARSGGIVLMDGFEEASAALQRARVTVSALNTTQAHFNSLQAGLQAVAAETGGLYAGTYDFPEQAVARVSQLLSGHYVLFVEKPDLRKGVHGIDVRLVGRRGTVMARRRYVQER